MDIKYLKGVGEKKAEKLAKLGLTTVQNLLYFYPRDYIDFSAPYSVETAPLETKCTVKAMVYGKSAAKRLPGGKTLIQVSAGDESGALKLSYFNNPYSAEKLVENEEYLFFGKVTGNLFVKQMVNPLMLTKSQVGQNPFMPIYPQTEGINSNFIAQCVKKAFDKIETIPEPIPDFLIQKYKLCSKQEALQKIHFPKTSADIHTARRRLIFEELLCLQIGLLLLRNRDNKLTSAPIKTTEINAFFENLPFKPTNAQMRSIDEIAKDMQKPNAMNRLLQGDVGSGKTLVAAAAMAISAANGYQSVLMAPTEILAAQHAETLQKMLEPLGLQIALLTGSVKGKTRTALLNAIQNGQANIIVGTHAVLSEGVIYNNLGLAVTDEQHRFGVRQRNALASKASHPHLLVMSATPIPRTLALLMFGDLDISILDEKPNGRKEIKTYAITGKKRQDMFGFIAEQLKENRQAYIVCPMIEELESDNLSADLQAVTTYIKDIAQPLLPNARIGLMHGKLKPKEKAEVMQQFKEHQLDVLVSTTVIEVGVDVPNANLMVIENAERYGLSALHQLRGRVGRGEAQSYCILISDHSGEAVKERLRFLCHSTDGFEIAKFDLENRGPGDFFGSRQHGLPTLQIADLMADTRVLHAAQEQAIALVEQDPTLENYPILKQSVEKLFSVNTSMN